MLYLCRGFCKIILYILRIIDHRIVNFVAKLINFIDMAKYRFNKTEKGYKLVLYCYDSLANSPIYMSDFAPNSHFFALFALGNVKSVRVETVDGAEIVGWTDKYGNKLIRTDYVF